MAHATWMAWSYVILMEAFAADSLTRLVMPRITHLLADNGQAWGAFWASVGVASVLVIAIGSRVVEKRLPAVVASTPEAMRRERARLSEADAELTEDPTSTPVQA
jgi:hypothetical protein